MWERQLGMRYDNHLCTREVYRCLYFTQSECIFYFANEVGSRRHLRTRLLCGDGVLFASQSVFSEFVNDRHSQGTASLPLETATLPCSLTYFLLAVCLVLRSLRSFNTPQNIVWRWHIWEGDSERGVKMPHEELSPSSAFPIASNWHTFTQV